VGLDFGKTPAFSSNQEIKATIAWLDDEPLVAGRAYWALHGHRWVKAKIAAVVQSWISILWPTRGYRACE
jgi:sulfate adenylyltransferase subunit 1